MRPIQLKLKGLNSFIEEQTIDFTKLMDNGLFGIFGPTGSGKSTILEGMILALYGNSKKISTNPINMNCDELSVCFKFQISDAKKHIYEVTRYFKRDKKKGTALQKNAVIKDITDEQPQILAEGDKGVTTACEKIIGLGLEDFTRTVVLPQGRFSEFLKLEGTKRREMLERLFHLQAYGDELSNNLKLKMTHNKDELSQVIGEINSYSQMTPEALKQEKERLSILTAQLVALKKKQEDIAKRYKKGERIWQLQNDLKKYKEKQSILEHQIDEIEDKKFKVQKGESAERIRPRLAAFEEIKAILESETQKRQQLEIEKDKLSLRKQELDQKFEVVRIEKEETLVQLSKVQEHIKEAHTLTQDLKKVDDELKEIEQKLQGVKGNLTKFESQYKMKVDKLKEIIEEQKKQQQEIEQVKVDSLIYSQISKGNDLTTKAQLYNERLEELKKEYQDDSEDYKEKLKKHQSIELDSTMMPIVNALRHALKEGTPCPVCGSLHHFEADYQEKMKKKEQKIKALQLKLNPVQEDLKKLQQEYKTEDFKKLHDSIIEKGKKYDVLNQELMQLTKQIEDLREENDKILKDQNEWEKCYARGLTKQETYLKQKEEKTERLKERFDRIVSLTPKNYQEVVKSAINNLSTLQDYLQQVIQKIERNYQTLSLEREQVQESLEQITSQLLETKTTQEVHSNQLQLEEEQLTILLKEEKITLEEVHLFLLSKEQLQHLKDEIQTYQDTLTELKGSIEVILKQLGQDSIEEERWLELQKEYIEIQRELENKITENSKCQTLLEQLEVGLQKLRHLQEKRNTLEHSLAIWNDLKKLFEGKKFVEFVATNRLKYISLEASKKLLEITNGNYGLEVNRDGKFLIRDYKNGGARRDASTLSGGETFLVSLALALSLSAEIQLKGTAPLELFFLDEGFGTLDDTLLDIVMGSLESLHHDKLRVGIISHVESIKERVPKKLILTPAIAGEGGTKIKLE